MGPKSSDGAADQDLFRMELVNLIDQRQIPFLAGRLRLCKHSGGANQAPGKKDPVSPSLSGLPLACPMQRGGVE